MVEPRGTMTQMAAVIPGAEQAEQADPDSGEKSGPITMKASWNNVLNELQDVIRNQSIREESSEKTPGVQDLSCHPATIQCPSCQQQVTTEVQHKLGSSSYLLCCVFALFGCICGCCLLPFFLSYFKDTKHLCPSCHNEIGIFSRL